MPTNHTPNYQLSLWERADKVQMEDFNEDNAKIDAALKAETDARTALATQVAKRGNCQIWTGTYVGNGEAGIGKPTSFTFPKKPLAAFIIDDYEPRWIFPWSGNLVTTQYNTLKWNGNTISWYLQTAPDRADPQKQLNYLGSTYRVVAFFEADK